MIARAKDAAAPSDEPAADAAATSDSAAAPAVAHEPPPAPPPTLGYHSDLNASGLGAIPPGRVVLTLDIEGDFGTSSLRGVDKVLPRLLDGFDEHGISVCLFVVGDVARRRESLIRQAADRGHLIGSHTMTHRPLRRLTSDERRVELADSRAFLEDLTGRPCVAFRAPFFDVPHDLGPLLEDTGYSWSSSKAPFSFVALFRNYPQTRKSHFLDDSRIIEIPVPGIFGLPIPDGLSYRRLFHPVTALGTTPPSVFYLHPYELLEDAYRFGYTRLLAPFMTFRKGTWAGEHLWGLISAWKKRGAVFAPPDLPTR